MNNFPKKRTNPFEKPITGTKEQKSAPVVEVKEEIVETDTEIEEQDEEIEEYVEPTPVIKRPTPKPAPKSAPKSSRSNNRNVYIYDDTEERMKYTATMSKELRRRIKVVCAQRDIMFSQFIEQACIEKLNREGDR